jgi:subtilisin-like proprotein convertase family protein
MVADHPPKEFLMISRRSFALAVVLTAGLYSGCSNGTATSPNCSDGVQNGVETDIDCGGLDCDACAPGKSCVENDDCTFNICDENNLCLCEAGYADDGAGDCADVDECTEATAGCHADATCTNTDGGFTCECNSPLVGDGFNCVDPSDCTDDPNKCAANATCTDQGDGTSLCVCDTGHAGDGLTCADVDECTEGTAGCHADATCTNTDGGFTCECNPPLVGDGFNCGEASDCTDDPNTCGANATCTDQGDGTSLCNCDTGYTGDGLSCADVDECANSTDGCDALATCANTDCGFTCTCPTGYDDTNADGTLCTDINECATSADNCDALATCANTDGGFTCTCPTGYDDTNADGTLCTDIDECATGADNCDASVGVCTNTPGSFTCACPVGYDDTNADGTLCTDIDECATGADNCDALATCANIDGGFTCTCPAGYDDTNADGTLCTDIDECATGADNCDIVATCSNTAGTFTCTCPVNTIDVNGNGTLCEYFPSCYDILVDDPSKTDGAYMIDPDGNGMGAAAFNVYCDMTTDGGGWTIVYSATGADAEVPMVSDTVVVGDPLTFAHYNLNRDQKMALSAISSESIFVRSTGEWIAASHELFDGRLVAADSHAHYPVSLRTSDGTYGTDAWMGWSNTSIAGGGDFNLSIADGGTRVEGVDHHYPVYNHLNAGCVGHYLYSYSAAAQDGDAGYDVNTTLGDWAVTDGCNVAEGGALMFYAAMRPAHALSCQEILFDDATATDGVYSLSPHGQTFDAYCDMTTDGGGWTLVGRILGTDNNFSPISTSWTDGVLINENTATSTIDTTTMKSQAWIDVPSDSVKLCHEGHATSCANFTHNRYNTLSQLFATPGAITTTEAWTFDLLDTVFNRAEVYTPNYQWCGINYASGHACAAPCPVDINTLTDMDAGNAARIGCIGDASATQAGGPDDYALGIGVSSCQSGAGCGVLTTSDNMHWRNGAAYGTYDDTAYVYVRSLEDKVEVSHGADAIDVPIAIPDANPAGVSSTLDFPYACIIDDVIIATRITHSWRGDLIVTLTAPDSTTRLLLNMPGGGGDSGDHVIGHFPVTLTPIEDLSVLNGIEAQGAWSLHVSDNQGWDTGTIEWWSVIVTCQ